MEGLLLTLVIVLLGMLMYQANRLDRVEARLAAHAAVINLQARAIDCLLEGRTWDAEALLDEARRGCGDV